MVARKPSPERPPADAAAAGKQLLKLDPRFQTLLFLAKDLDAAVEQLAWDYEYMRWYAAFQQAARSMPAVPPMSVAAVAFLKSLASQGDADAQWKLDAFERARIISEEAEVARRVSLAAAQAMPRALEDQGVMMGVVALGAARRLKLELEPRHYLLLAIWSGLEEPIAGRGWAQAVQRWTRRAGTIRSAAEQLEQALRARGRGAAGRTARRGPPVSE